MSNYTEPTVLQDDEIDVTERLIQEQINVIRRNWSPAERANRHALGRARRESLLVTLGIGGRVPNA
ncbi:hypothetical protein [Stieleria mannarensis]|uniref:hypothetical protein n=1 Tax=Stieleria mannarensis TaxID=2755585 RepID=UPI0015FFAE25|nr:hypothetical protein [Rhodopirellula sp. JC639]